MANVGNYQAAVDLFSQAINLDAKDFRFVCCPHRLFIRLILQPLCKYPGVGVTGDLLVIDSRIWENYFQNVAVRNLIIWLAL